ncbi:MAG: tRNA lysidine(34) synthetase TilS [Chloroflexota bacterium]
MLIERFRQILQQECPLDPDRLLLVGVSGGPDSLCLLDLLWQLGFSLAVAHLDHGLRPESQEEAGLVRQWVEQKGLPFYLERLNVAALAKSQGLSIEEAARTARYRFLFKQAAQCQAQAVAVGHTADDQVETVLMHLLRGAGLSGLRGMACYSLPNAWSQELPLVRPLLSIWREEILEHLHQRGLQPVLDASNQDTRFFRNRLRHELIPILETYNPQVRQRLWRTAQVLHQDYSVLERLVESAWQICLRQHGPGYLSLDPQALAAQPLSIQRYLVRRAIAQLQPDLRDVDFEAIERALAFLHRPSRMAQLNLVAGLRLFIEADQLWLANWQANLPADHWPQVSPDRVLTFNPPGTLQLSQGWAIHATIVEDTRSLQEFDLQNNDPFQAWLDLDRLSLPLQVSSMRPGQRFQPLGMSGHSLKMSDFFINVRLPRRARRAWPLVLSSGEIAWVPGFRLGHPFRLSAQTRLALLLRLERSE